MDRGLRRPALWATALPMLVSMLAVSPVSGDQLPSGEIPLVDSREAYERTTALMAHADEAVTEYVTQSVETIRQGYEMGFASFSQWCREHEDALRNQTSGELLGRLLQSGLGASPPGVAGASSAFMQELQQTVGSAGATGGNPSGGVEGFIRAHEQAVQRALSGLSGLPERFERAHSGVIAAARHALIIDPQVRPGEGEQPFDLTPGAVRVLRQAGVPAPGSETAHAFAQSVLARQMGLVGQSEGIAIGGPQEREVPDHLDRELATMESATQSGIAGRTTCFLVSQARSSNGYLMHPPSPMGPCQRHAVATTLIGIYRELDARLGRARLGPDGIPQNECLEMDAGSPMAGDLGDVAPFSMLDTWTSIQSEASRACPSRSAEASGTTARRPPRSQGTSPSVLRPEFSWRAESIQPAHLPSQPATSPLNPSPQVGDVICLSIASPPRDLITEYEFRVVSAPDGRSVNVAQTNAHRNTFRLPAAGTYVVELEVATQRGRLRPARQSIDVAVGSPPPNDDEREAPEPAPGGSVASCASNPPPSRWLECAIQEPYRRNWDEGCRRILRAFRTGTLDRAWIPLNVAVALSRGDAVDEQYVEQQSRHHDIVRDIESALAGRSGGYQAFLDQFFRLREGVRGSARVLNGGSIGMQDWYRHQQQRNPQSVYTVVLP